MRHGRRERAFTLVELVVVITLLGILAAFAVPRFLALNGAAERAVVESFVGTLKSARALAYADFAARGQLPVGYTGPQDFTLFNLTRCDDGEPQARDDGTPGSHYAGLNGLRAGIFRDPGAEACTRNTIQFVTRSGRTVTISGTGAVTWTATPSY